MALQWDQSIPAIPVAVDSIFDFVSDPPIPALAIAAGSYIHMFRHRNPPAKFNLPPSRVDRKEESIWRKIRSLNPHSDTFDSEVDLCIAGMAHLATLPIRLTSKTHQVLSFADPAERRLCVREYLEAGLESQVDRPCVTCMKSMPLHAVSPGQTSTSTLVLGTEDARVLIMRPQTSGIDAEIELPSTPAFIHGLGVLDGEHRITISCRDGQIMQVRNKSLSLEGQIMLPAPPCAGLVRIDKFIIQPCMDLCLRVYSYKGTLLLELPQNAPIMSICQVSPSSGHDGSAFVALGLADGTLKLVDIKSGVSLHERRLPSPAQGMVWGRYGYEDDTLVLSLKSGVLLVLFLRRTADLKTPWEVRRQFISDAPSTATNPLVKDMAPSVNGVPVANTTTRRLSLAAAGGSETTKLNPRSPSRGPLSQPGGDSGAVDELINGEEEGADALQNKAKTGRTLIKDSNRTPPPALGGVGSSLAEMLRESRTMERALILEAADPTAADLSLQGALMRLKIRAAAGALKHAKEAAKGVAAGVGGAVGLKVDVLGLSGPAFRLMVDVSGMGEASEEGSGSGLGGWQVICHLSGEGFQLDRPVQRFSAAGPADVKTNFLLHAKGQGGGEAHVSVMSPNGRIVATRRVELPIVMAAPDLM